MKRTKILGYSVAAILAIATIAIPSGVKAADASTTQTVITSSTFQTDSSVITFEISQDDKKIQASPEGQVFQIVANSQFNPLDFTGTSGQQYKFSAGKNKIKIVSNDVDTSKAGKAFNVKLEATNSKGVNTTITYRVFVKPEGLYQLNLLPRNWVTGAPFAGSKPTFYQGEKWYIGDPTKYLDGQFYTHISKVSQVAANENKPGNWIPTKYLANDHPEAKIIPKTVMHTALAYSYGGSSKYRKYKAYQQIYVKADPVTFNGGKYYQVYEKDGMYTSDYLKISNIDGTKRILKRNAYIYATSSRRANNRLLKKGSTVTTYGSSYKFKNGKNYYRVGGPSKQYIRTSNF